MQQARNQSRVAIRLPLDLFVEKDRQPQRCQSIDIDLDGVTVAGACALREGAAVRVVIDPDSHSALHLDARVSRVMAQSIDCEFVDNSAASLEVLEALLTPTWDGENLLDGVIRFAPWHRADDLAGWMRLTSLVSDWDRLTRLSGRY